MSQDSEQDALERVAHEYSVYLIESCQVQKPSRLRDGRAGGDANLAAKRPSMGEPATKRRQRLLSGVTMPRAAAQLVLCMVAVCASQGATPSCDWLYDDGDTGLKQLQWCQQNGERYGPYLWANPAQFTQASDEQQEEWLIEAALLNNDRSYEDDEDDDLGHGDDEYMNSLADASWT